MRNFILTFLALIFFSAPAAANMANPERPGGVVGELTGDVSNLAVEHEALELDLRPIADGESGRVRAQYTVRNDHGEMPLELQFVALNLGADPEAIEVSFDGSPVAFDVRHGAPIPQRWQLGERQGHFVDQLVENPHRDAKTITSIFFELAVPGGEHEIQVSYPVEPWENTYLEELEPLRGSAAGVRYSTYTVPYVLAPARDWGEFGTLEIRVLAPAGWNVITSPDLEDAGDQVFSRQFDGIPADGFFVGMQPKVIPSIRMGLALMLFFVVLFALTFALPFRIGRRSIRRDPDDVGGRKRPEAKRLALAVVMVILCGGFSVPLAITVHEVVGASSHLHPGWGYAFVFFGAFLVPVSLVLSAVTFGAGLALARRAQKRGR